jgi:hypothetical protein
MSPPALDIPALKASKMAVLPRILLTIRHKLKGASKANVIRRVAVLFTLAFISVCLVTLQGFLYDTYNRIATIDLSDGYTLKLWNESEGILGNWDPDNPYPSIYYQIEKSGNIAVPKTYLHLDLHYTYDIKVVFAETGRLACVYDTKLWTKGLYIIWDAESGESWPRLRDDEVSYESSVKQKWLERYTRLKLENPTLPQFD